MSKILKIVRVAYDLVACLVIWQGLIDNTLLAFGLTVFVTVAFLVPDGREAIPVLKEAQDGVKYFIHLVDEKYKELIDKYNRSREAGETE